MSMPLKEELAAERERWKLLNFYQKFEHAVILVLTALIAVVVAFAVWNLVVKILLSILSAGGFDPTDYGVFQALFGMIFTVIIALIQAVAVGHCGTSARDRPGSHRGFDRPARHRPEADDHRHLGYGGRAAVRAVGGDSGARHCVLARSRSGQARTCGHPFLTLFNRRYAMTTRKLDKKQWRTFFDRVTKMLEGKRAEIEIVSLRLGDQVEAEWLPLLGIAYDPNDDIVEIALEGLDHLIPNPREIYVEEGPETVEALEIVDADDARQIVRLRDPLMLPASAQAKQ
jgi:Family of unknown function (DUF5335)